MELTKDEKLLAQLGDTLLHKIDTCKRAIYDLKIFIKDAEKWDKPSNGKDFRKLRNKLYLRLKELEKELKEEYGKTNKKTSK